MAKPAPRPAQVQPLARQPQALAGRLPEGAARPERVRPTAAEAGAVLGAVHTVGDRSAAPAPLPSPDSGVPLLQLALAAQMALAVVLLALGKSARLVSYRVPSMAVVGRAAPALLTAAFYVLICVLCILAALAVSSLLLGAG